MPMVLISVQRKGFKSFNTIIYIIIITDYYHLCYHYHINGSQLLVFIIQKINIGRITKVHILFINAIIV